MLQHNGSSRRVMLEHNLREINSPLAPSGCSGCQEDVPHGSFQSGRLLAPYRSDHVRWRSNSGSVFAAQRFSRAMTSVSARVMAS